MNNPNFNTIDPTQANIPLSADVRKVYSEDDRLPNGEHDKAVKAFLISDGIASGIGKDLAFVDKIPQLINEIIDNKSWECLYVAKGVMTAYYCRYIKGSDSENFRAFISAKRPNGLETSVETLDRVLQADLEVQRKFRAIIYESRQGERTDLINETSAPQESKLFAPSHQKRIRAANRAAESIPVIGELLDRGLIAIDIAAMLGRDIKDPENLTAEEREYVDKRDLIGLRINQYIYTNPIPDDEDKEPYYSRELNSFIKDLLGIKERSKSVRMDNPKKAAEKLLQFYQGEKLFELVNYLRQGLEPSVEPPTELPIHGSSQTKVYSAQLEMKSNKPDAEELNTTKLPHQNADTSKTSQVYESQSYGAKTSGEEKGIPSNSSAAIQSQRRMAGDSLQPLCAVANNLPDLKPKNENNFNTSIPENFKLTGNELAERLRVKPTTVNEVQYKRPQQFPQWSQKKDPEGIAWQRIEEKRGRYWLFSPVQGDTPRADTGYRQVSHTADGAKPITDNIISRDGTWLVEDVAVWEPPDARIRETEADNAPRPNSSLLDASLKPSTNE